MSEQHQPTETSQPTATTAPPYGYTPVPPPSPAPMVVAPPAGREGGFRRGFGLGAGAGVGLATVLGIASIISSLIAAVVMAGALSALAAAGSAGSQPLETIWGSPTAPNTLRAIRVTGPILTSADDGVALTASTYGYEVAAMIDSLQAKDAAGLLLLVNTPGGSVTGSKAIADAVVRYQERTGKKVVAHVQGMAASGGMYAMAGADEIIADYGSLIGSIGVIYGPFARYRDVVAVTGTAFEPGVVTNGGITEEYLTQGKDKDFGNPYRDMTAGERQVIMDGMANVYGDFVTWVATSRKISADKIRNDLGAHIFDPKTAIEKGLVDKQLGLDAAYRRAAEVAGVDPSQTRVVTVAAPSYLQQLLGAQARTYGQGPASARAAEGRVTASICSKTPSVLLFHGALTSVCG